MAANSPSALLLRRKLSGFGRQVRLYHMLRGVCAVVLLLLVAALATLLLDLWLRLSAGVRFAIGLSILAGVAVQVWRLVIAPQRMSMTPASLAAAIDRGLSRGGAPASRFSQAVATLESAGTPDGDTQLAAEARRLAAERAADLDIGSHLEHDQFARHYLMLGLLAAAPLMFSLVAPEVAGTWWNRWVLGIDQKWPQRTRLAVAGMEGDRLTVPAGEAFELLVYAVEGSEVPPSVEIDYKFDGRLSGQDVLNREGENDFRYRIPALREQAIVTLYGGDDVLGPLVFEARPRPVVESYAIESFLPQTGERSRMEFATQDRDMSFKAETRLSLTCETDQDLRDVALKGGHPRSTTVERTGPRQFRIAWTHTGRVVLSMELTAAATGLVSRPHVVTFGFLEDAPPSVSLTVEGVRDRIAPGALLPVRVLARDDQGLLNVDAHVLRSSLPDLREAEEIFREEILGSAGGAEPGSCERLVEIDLRPLGLKPMRYLHVGATARDDAHTGPQTSEARRRLLRIVEPEQLNAEIRARIEKTRGRLRAALASARDCRDSIAGDSEGARTGETLRRHRNIEREVWSAERTLSASGREMELNRLIEAHAVRKLDEEVLAPLGRLHETHLKAQRAALEAASQAWSWEDREAALARQDATIAGLERVLRNLAEWDSFVDFVVHLTEIIERQEEIRRQTRDSGEEKDRD